MSVDDARASSPGERSLVRHEEELDLSTEAREIGAVTARKRVESHRVAEVVPRSIEDADVERTGPHEHDSGRIETLADGSVSVPILEEELVVTKRIVVRERIVIRKRTTTEEQRIEAELRRERVEIDGAEPPPAA